MMIQSTAAVALALTLVVASSTASRANPLVRAAPRTAQRLQSAAASRIPARSRHAFPVMPTRCSTNYPTAGQFFVGVTNGSNVAGGPYTGVLGGESNEACDETDGIAAGFNNTIGNDGAATSSFIGGGGNNAITALNSAIGNGYYNEVAAEDGFDGAGVYNTIEGDGAFVGAGGEAYYLADGSPSAGNGNVAAGEDSFIGAGDLNQISSAASGSFIGAGDTLYANQSGTAAGNQISGADSFIGAGDRNAVAGNEAFVGGGYVNAIAAAGTFSAIAGGNANAANGTYEAIGGGYDNVAKGADATIPGGNRNEAYGELSFAAGYQAHALYTGSFVWSDYHSGSSPLADKAADQFVVRASGGTYVYSNEADTSGVDLPAGSGTWSNLSDRNAKTDIVPLDDASILAKVASLPVSTWQYKTERGVLHVGPMAQDFYAAFGVGENDRHITSIDEDGVALSAIKALAAKLERKDVQIDRLQSRLAAVEARDEILARRLEALAR